MINLNESELKDFQNNTIFPLMCMASVEPLKVKQQFFQKINPLNFNLINNAFDLNFSAFKKEQDGLGHLTFVIQSLNLDILPEFFSTSVNDFNSEEAKDFLIRPLRNFQPFKKAILLFEDKEHSLEEFKNLVINWKKSLKIESE